METKVSCLTALRNRGGQRRRFGDIGRRAHTVPAPTGSKFLLARCPTPAPSGPSPCANMVYKRYDV